MIAVVVPAAPGLLPCEGLQDPFAEVRTAIFSSLSGLSGRPGGVRLVAGDAQARRVGESLVSQAGLELAGPDLGGFGLGGSSVGGSGLGGSGLGGSTVGGSSVGGDALVVVADGSATRSEKAPGHFDPRSHAFDETITTALARGDSSALAALDPDLAEQLWCRGVPALHELARHMPAVATSTLHYAADPFGVMYWVARWES